VCSPWPHRGHGRSCERCWSLSLTASHMTSLLAVIGVAELMTHRDRRHDRLQAVRGDMAQGDQTQQSIDPPNGGSGAADR
jgi:hypothetical protein